MVSIFLPEWLCWLFIVMSSTIMVQNFILIYYKRRTALAWERLDAVTQIELGGKVVQ